MNVHGLIPLTCLLAIAVLPSTASENESSVGPSFKTNEIQLKAVPFNLGDVRLLGSIFKDNQENDGRYILSLDPERLLYNFRNVAGIKTNMQPYGGWESPKLNIRGHFMGHYLSACAEMYAATGDKRFRERGEYIVNELAKYQKAIGTGNSLCFEMNVGNGRKITLIPFSRSAGHRYAIYWPTNHAKRNESN
jgi:hypothetical protein